MGLLNNDLTAKDIVAVQKYNGTQLKNFLQADYERTFNGIWRDDNVGVQDILNEYGTDAAVLFAVSQKIVEILMLLDSSYVPPALPDNVASVTVNPDGTVTVTFK